MFSDLGADVIKIEPPAGDLTRFATPKVDGLSTYFVQQNAGKRYVSIDSPPPRGQPSRPSSPSGAMLGYDDTRIDELEAAGVLSSRPPRR